MSFIYHTFKFKNSATKRVKIARKFDLGIAETLPMKRKKKHYVIPFIYA